jgi:hypothetical protein
MIEDMNARKLSEGTQRGHIRACERFAVFLKRLSDTAEADDVRRFQLHLMKDGTSIQSRNRTMTGVRFLLRITRQKRGTESRNKAGAALKSQIIPKPVDSDDSPIASPNQKVDVDHAPE